MFARGIFLLVEDAMPHDEDKLTPDPRDLCEAVAFALRFFKGRKRNRDADSFRATLAAERVLRHLERAGFVVMKKPPVGDIRRSEGGFEGSRAQPRYPYDRGYEIRAAMGIAERETEADNAAFTNVAAVVVLREAIHAAEKLGRAGNPEWARIAESIVLLKEGGVIVLPRWPPAR